MKRTVVCVASLAYLVAGCTAAPNDASTRVADGEDASAPPSSAASAPATRASTSGEIDAVLSAGHVTDATTLRIVGDGNAADYRVRAQRKSEARGLIRPMTAGTPWEVLTGKPVHASPTTYSGWFQSAASDLLAFGVDGTGATRGVSSGVATTLTAPMQASGISILTNLYSAAQPSLYAWALSGGTDTFGLSGLVFNLDASKLYALSAQGTLHCFTVTAGLMSECAGFPFTSSNNVTWSSPYPTYVNGGLEIQSLYFGDDAGHLYCVNGTGAGAGNSCWGTPNPNPATLANPADGAKVGAPVVIADAATGAPVVFVGDDKGRFFRVVDTGSTPVPGSNIASQDLCGGTPNTCSTTPWAIRGMPVVDTSGSHVYVASGGSMFEFPLLASANWQQTLIGGATPSAKVLVPSASLNAPIEGSPILDHNAHFAYLAFHNTLYKIPYPFDGTQTAYSTTLQAKVATGTDATADRFPHGWPLPYYSTIYLGTGAKTASTGILEQYGCTGSTKAPVLQSTSKVTYGSNVETGVILDWVNGNLNFGVDVGGATGGIVQYPAANPDPASTWGCPTGTAAVAGLACSSQAGCAAGCTVDANCAKGSNVATEHCNTTTGACEVLTCSGTFADCDGSNANGCEVDTSNSIANCGGCGTVCSTTNDVPTCTTGSCVASCNAGYSACGVAGNIGCPSTTACGTSGCCGSTCGGGTSCDSASGTCTSATQHVCATVSEHATATVSCPAGTTIQAVSFVSYGTPNGSCGAFTVNHTCDDALGNTQASANDQGYYNERKIASDLCLGKTSCSMLAESKSLQADGLVLGEPCLGTFKRLYLQVECACAPVLGACANGFQDGSETDVDCGGTCGTCAGGKTCLVAGDCASGSICSGHVCKGPQSAACTGASGCESNVCTLNQCAPPACAGACATGTQCEASSDCASANCLNGKCRLATGASGCGGVDANCVSGNCDFSGVCVPMQAYTTPGTYTFTQASLCPNMVTKSWAGGGAGSSGAAGGGGGEAYINMGYSDWHVGVTVTVGGGGKTVGTGGAAGGGLGRGGGGGGGGYSDSVWVPGGPYPNAIARVGAGGGAGLYTAGGYNTGGGTTGSGSGVCTGGIGGINATGGAAGSPADSAAAGGFNAGGTGGLHGGGGGGSGYVGGGGGGDSLGACGAGGGAGGTNFGGASPSFGSNGANGSIAADRTDPDYLTYCATGAPANGAATGGAIGQNGSDGCVIARCYLSGAGAACTATTDCYPGYACSSFTGLCVGGLGATCAGNTACESQNCVSTKCAAPTCAGTCTAGQPCEVGSDCSSGVCQASFTCAGIANGGACVADTDCTSGDCNGGTCAGASGDWPFEEGSGTTTADLSGNGDTATLTSTSWLTSASCHSGACLSFSAGKVTMPLTASLKFGTGDFTVSAWVKTTTASSEAVVVGTNRCFISEGWLLSVTNAKAAFAMFGTGASGYVTSAATVNDGTWHHLTGVRSGTSQLLYVDGALAVTGSVTAAYNSNSAGTSMSVGDIISGCSRQYVGSIDSVRVYPRALSVTEIAGL